MALTSTLLTLLAAIIDWIAVGRLAARPGAALPRTVERAAKPLTLVLLIGAALAIAHDHPGHSAVVLAALLVALGFSLVGDVALLFAGPDDGPENFVRGLGAFLLAHLAYIVAFVKLHNTLSYAISFVVTGIVLAVAAFAAVGRKIVAGAGAEDPQLGRAVLAYLVVISLMVVAAWWTGDMRIILGALLFAFSDAVIGWTKFVRADRRGPVVVIVTYHLAQILLVLGLLRR